MSEQTGELTASGRPSLSARRRLQLAIFAGGVAGALARAGLGEALPWDGHGWPWATFLVNVVGTLMLGYFATRLQERLPPASARDGSLRRADDVLRRPARGAEARPPRRGRGRRRLHVRQPRRRPRR